MNQAAQPKIGIVMGSDSDWPTMEATADVLQEFGVPYEADVVEDPAPFRAPQPRSRRSRSAAPLA